MKSKPHIALIISVIVAAIILVIAGLTADRSGNVTRSTGEASISFLGPVSGILEVGQTQHVQWTSQNYSAPTVGINVIRKVSDSPLRYELVRTIAAATTNDGDAVWVPAATDVGDNIVIEVTCAPMSVSCKSSQSTGSLAVVKSERFANTASVYNAIENRLNQ